MGEIMEHRKKVVVWAGIVLSALLLGYVVFDKMQRPPQATQAGSITLSWTAPTENEDDSPLTNLSGYAIHYISKEGEYSDTVYVDDPQATSFTVQNLLPGTYYFSINAINATGAESTLSNVITKTVP